MLRIQDNQASIIYLAFGYWLCNRNRQKAPKFEQERQNAKAMDRLYDAGLRDFDDSAIGAS
jgi:hypothetical protein